MKAELIADCTVNNAPKKAGDIVEVDQNTFDNMVRKGLLKAAPAASTDHKQGIVESAVEKVTKVVEDVSDAVMSKPKRAKRNDHRA